MTDADEIAQPIATPAREERSQRLIGILQIISYITGILALLTVWIQMQSDAAALRSQISLDYVQTYNSGPISAHRLRLDRAWLDFSQDLEQINQSDGIPPEEMDVFVRHVIGEYDRRNPSDPAILSIQELTAFYDSINICIENNVCEGKILRSYFSQSAHDFAQLYRSYIGSFQRTVSPNFGEGLNDFIEVE